MAKLIKAVAPYQYKDGINFKTQTFDAWVKVGGQVAKSHYPPRFMHGLFFRQELPMTCKSKKEARLRFVEPISLSFDTFPDYCQYEIIPFIWDCWPCYFEKVCSWFDKHKVKTAIFTSSQTAERMQKRFPEMNIMYCPEAVNTSRYNEGRTLVEREIDVLEFGRASNLNIDWDGINYICTKKNGKYLYSNKQLPHLMGNSKITIALPRSITEPQKAGDIETLTQRYWENMLSRIVMVGHAPQELIDLIGYNPVIELDLENANMQTLGIATHIDDYQNLVDKNRKVALEIGDWRWRMKEVFNFLKQCDYLLE